MGSFPLITCPAPEEPRQCTCCRQVLCNQCFGSHLCEDCFAERQPISADFMIFRRQRSVPDILVGELVWGIDRESKFSKERQ